MNTVLNQTLNKNVAPSPNTICQPHDTVLFFPLVGRRASIAIVFFMYTMYNILNERPDYGPREEESFYPDFYRSSVHVHRCILYAFTIGIQSVKSPWLTDKCLRLMSIITASIHVLYSQRMFDLCMTSERIIYYAATSHTWSNFNNFFYFLMKKVQHESCSAIRTVKLCITCVQVRYNDVHTFLFFLFFSSLTHGRNM